MSLDLTVYCKEISKELVPKISRRLNEFDISVEIHPEFELDPETDSGFVPFKFRLNEPYFQSLANIDLVSGFEIYIEDFSLEKEKEQLQPKRTFKDKILGKKSLEIPFAPADVELKLKECNKAVHFVWHVADSFELRFASMTSAILTELTNGVCCYPADEIWYENNNIVEEAFKEVKEYETSIGEQDFVFQKFDQW